MRLSGPGPSGLRADHILLTYPLGVSDGLIGVLSKIICGTAPRWLADARLLAIFKKNGGVRPIAVGKVLSKIAAGLLIRASLPELNELPRQFVLRRHGCLAVASLVRASLESDPSIRVLTVDMRNAFNCVSRLFVIETSDNAAGALLTLSVLTGFAPIVRQPRNLLSPRRAEGEPEGPSLFTLALSLALERARMSFPEGLLDFWYADDGCIIGSLNEVTAGFDSLLEPLKSIG